MGRNFDNIRVMMADFVAGLQLVGSNASACVGSNEQFPYGVIPYGPTWDNHVATLASYIRSLRVDKTPRCMRILLDGCQGSGKSSLARYAAESSGFPCITIARPGDLAFETDAAQKVLRLRNIFFRGACDWADRVIILDDVERLLEYSAYGEQHSVALLRAVEAMLADTPAWGQRRLVIGTTSRRSALDRMGLTQWFDFTQSVGSLAASEQRTFLKGLGVPFESPEAESHALSRMPAAVPVGKLVTLTEVARSLALSPAHGPHCQENADVQGNDNKSGDFAPFITDEVWKRAMCACCVAPNVSAT